jgi:hypothetical protein
MGETGTLDWEHPKDGPKHRRVGALTLAQLAVVRTGALLLEHLPLHHDLLEGLEHRFALQEREAERSRASGLPFDTRDFSCGFLAIVGDRHHLDLDLHGVSSAAHTNEWSCVLISRQAQWSGRNC